MIEVITYLQSVTFFGNSLYDYSLAFIVFILLVLILKIFQAIILVKLRKIASKTKTDFDDVVIEVFYNIRPPFYFFIALYFGIVMLNLSVNTVGVIKIVLIITIIIEVIRALEHLIDYAATRYMKRGNAQDQRYSQSIINALRILTRVVLWTVGIMLVLSNIGVNVNSLIASVGVGGIAVALALQNILSDIFSSFSIYIDKPFKIGDYITVGEHSGNVQKIGLKTTRLKTLRGEELIIANRELTSARVQNFKQLKKRREVFSLGLEYGIAADKLDKVPLHVKKLCEAIDLVEFERCYFKSYGDFSLNFEISYFVDSRLFKDAVGIRQVLNMAIYRKFEKEGITFAYPTQTIHLRKN